MSAFVAAVLALAPQRPAETARPSVVATIATGTVPVCVAYSGGRVWIVDVGQRLVEVDVSRRRVARRIPVGLSPTGLVADRGELWARVQSRTRTSPDQILRIDPATGRIVTRIAVPGGSGIAVDARFAWAPLARGIERIDRARGVVAGRLPVSGATDVVSAGGVLWAPTRDGALVEVDAATGRVIARFPGVVAPDTGSAMGTADRGLWLLDPQDARIVRFAGHRIVDEIPVVSGALPLLARTPEGLWTATGGSGSGAAEPTRLVRTDPDTHRVTGTVSLGAQAIHALFGAGRDLLVITDLGRVIVVRG